MDEKEFCRHSRYAMRRNGQSYRAELCERHDARQQGFGGLCFGVSAGDVFARHLGTDHRDAMVCIAHLIQYTQRKIKNSTSGEDAENSIYYDKS